MYGSNRLYARNGRQRHSRQNFGRGRQGKSKPLFFDACLRHDSVGRADCGIGICRSKARSASFRCGRRAAGRLCDLRFDFACVSAVFYAAIGISELFCNCRKNIRRPVGNSGRGINQHLAGFCFCRDFALGNMGRCAGNGYKRGCRRRNSRRLFFGKKRQPAPPDQNAFYGKIFSRFAETARRNFLPTFPPQ